MSDKLLIEQMTEQVETEVEKTAEEAEFEKVASVYNVVEQARTLTSVGEEMYKIASEIESEPLAALAVDTYTLGERMGSCLSKTASEDNSSLEEALEIASDMNKVASAYATIADEIKDEEFNKLAETVIGISNEMTDEANEVVGQIDKEAGVKETVTNAFKAKRVRDFAKNIQAQLKEEGHEMGKAKAYATAIKDAKGFKAKMRYLGDFKDPAIAYGGTAAALAGAGYGVKKATNKK